MLVINNENNSLGFHTTGRKITPTINKPIDIKSAKDFAPQQNNTAKTYADVSAYRNILDMLGTYESALNAWRNDLNNAWWEFIQETHASALSSLVINKVIMGLALKNTKGGDRYYKMRRLANLGSEKYGFKKFPKNHKGVRQFSFRAGFKKLPTRGKYDLDTTLSMARELNFELNRVRLPLPFNFRQLNDKLAGKGYNGKTTQGIINLIELSKASYQLKKSIPIIRTAVRKAIDNANLASQVREDTIRSEREELITRQKAAENAKIKQAQILLEKEKAYAKEIADAKQLTDDLRALKEELTLKLQTENTPEKEQKIIATINDVDNVIIDKIKSVDNAESALTVTTKQIKTLEPNIENIALIKNKKTPVMPLLITAAAGIILL